MRNIKIENIGKNQNFLSFKNSKNETIKIYMSYGSLVSYTITTETSYKIFIIEKFYKFSKTTSKYLYKFLNITQKDIEKGIKNGVILLVNDFKI